MSATFPTRLALPHDILDRIFQWLPTFQTLSAAKLVSKTWYQVFQTHPKSIVRSVATNVLGPVAEAIRVLRYFRDDAANEDRFDIDALSQEEYRSLQENAAVVRKLEEAFSLRYKDSLSPTSQLAQTESWRFARAMYRIMLYCAVFSMPDDEDQVNDFEENYRSEIEAQRAAMLREYPTRELLELNGALVFLRAIAHEAGPDYIDDEEDDFRVGSDILISTGPATVLQAHQAQSGDIMVEAVGYTVWSAGPYRLLLDFFTGPLTKICDERAVAAPSKSEAALHGTLLDEVTYRSVPCAQCGAESTTKLRQEDNWADLHLDIRKLLLGNLAHNFIEMEFLDDSPPEPNSFKLMSELFALKTEDFADWHKSDALCNACLTKFVSAHLHSWLLARKLKGGWEATGDCWYGYDCTTQTEVTLHAMTKSVRHRHAFVQRDIGT
ncbi:hypothetical protein DFH06DRAFT_1159929 [Mycena polygramma]|nr:hypothetical protein DFH06DRAFT_1159929 [Mycena polygramma]